MKGVFSFLWDTGKIIILAFLIVLPIRAWVFQPFLVQGDSMKPNFHNGDYLIIDELTYAFRNPQRGEVIVFKFPGDLSQRYIKRVIGLPGETVEIKDNTIAVSHLQDVSGEKKMVLHESYIPESLFTHGSFPVTLKENEYFMLGDNRPNSSDSRVWGVLPKSDIIGRVLVRVFPPQAFTIIAAPSY